MDKQENQNTGTFNGPFGQTCAYACPPVDFKPEPLIPVTTVITTPPESKEREIPIPEGYEAVIEKGRVRIVRKKTELTELEQLFVREVTETFGAVTPVDEAAARETCAKLREAAIEEVLGEFKGVIATEDFLFGYLQAKQAFYDSFADVPFRDFLCQKVREWQRSGDDPGSEEFRGNLESDARKLLGIAYRDLPKWEPGTGARDGITCAAGGYLYHRGKKISIQELEARLRTEDRV